MHITCGYWGWATGHVIDRLSMSNRKQARVAFARIPFPPWAELWFGHQGHFWSLGRQKQPWVGSEGWNWRGREGQMGRGWWIPSGPHFSSTLTVVLDFDLDSKVQTNARFFELREGRATAPLGFCHPPSSSLPSWQGRGLTSNLCHSCPPQAFHDYTDSNSDVKILFHDSLNFFLWPFFYVKYTFKILTLCNTEIYMSYGWRQSYNWSNFTAIESYYLICMLREISRDIYFFFY